MPAIDLTTLAVCKAWVAAPASTGPGDADQVLARLVTTCSGVIMGYLQRGNLLSRDWSDAFNGNNNQTFFLKQWPVTKILSVYVGNELVPPSDGTVRGWVLNEWDGFPPGIQQSVTLIGGVFPRGRQNVRINYTAGYLAAEEQTVPADPFLLFVDQANGAWTAGVEVVYASSLVPLTLVTGTPAAGEYAYAAGLPGGYQFSAADEGADLLISYSYIPYAVGEAAMKLVGERYRYRGRIGERTKSLGGQTSASYDISDMPAQIKLDLQPYRKVLPL